MQAGSSRARSLKLKEDPGRNWFRFVRKGSEFRVLDNGLTRSVIFFERDQGPLSVVVVAETSARMLSNMEQMQLALRKFLASDGPPEEAALIAFSGHPRQRFHG